MEQTAPDNGADLEQTPLGVQALADSVAQLVVRGLQAQGQLAVAMPTGVAVQGNPRPMNWFEQHRKNIEHQMRQFRNVRQRWYELSNELRQSDPLTDEGTSLLYQMEACTQEMIGRARDIVSYLTATTGL